MKILLTEHHCVEVSACLVDDPNQPLSIGEASFARIKEDSVRLFKLERSKKIYPFLLQQKNETTFLLQADYYIGVDWLIPGVRFVQVEPKVNKRLAAVFNEATDAEEPEEPEVVTEKEETQQFVENVEVDYLRILLDIMSAGLPEAYTNKLVLIDWQTPRIPVRQKEDRLTPFLIVQFLQLLKTIVRKGLKKSYYKVQENLDNKVKGKMLIGANVKQNILKNRATQTYCEYQVFGEDNIENRFLKKVLRFASSYVANNKTCFAGNEVAIEHLINYCRPAFEQISSELNENQLKQVRHNPFFKEYKEAITVGRHILNKFAYNITETSNKHQTTPPFWIDMPKLFELYCYVQLLKANPEDKDDIHYQFSTYGNALDVLVSKPGSEMVIDAKYKMHYQKGQIHQDIRQVAGYARLKKVREKLTLKDKDDRNVNCLIIYPDMNSSCDANYSLAELGKKMKEIEAYHKVFKLGIFLPHIISAGED